jgi:hypothetical protein
VACCNFELALKFYKLERAFIATSDWRLAVVNLLASTIQVWFKASAADGLLF